MKQVKKYEIGDRQFEQRRLVLAQSEQIKEFFGSTFADLRELSSPSDPADQEDPAQQNRNTAGSIISLVGSRSTQLAAIVLREKGQPVQEKDLEELIAFLDDNLDAESAAEVISDFLALTPIASDFKALGTMATAIGEVVVTGLKIFSANLQEAISANETTSTGTTDTTTSPPGSNTDTGKPNSESTLSPSAED